MVRKISLLVGLVMVMLLAMHASMVYAAETTQATQPISLTASVLPAHTLGVELHDIGSSDGLVSLTSAVDFAPTATPWGTIAPDYLKVTVNDNSMAWRLRIYTDNFGTAPSTGTWGYNFGGLKGAVAGAKVALGWRNFTSKNSSIASEYGDPAKSTYTISGVSTAGWTFIKDKLDYNDPTTPGDESFTGSDAGGYCNIAFGSVNGTTIIKPEANIGDPLHQGMVSLLSRATPFYTYVEGDFSAAAGTTYTGALKLELLEQ